MICRCQTVAYTLVNLVLMAEWLQTGTFRTKRNFENEMEKEIHYLTALRGSRILLLIVDPTIQKDKDHIRKVHK